MRRLLYLLTVSVAVVGLAACEDDPIVGPSGEGGSSGSYGKIQQLPADTPDVPAETPRYNPERF